MATHMENLMSKILQDFLQCTSKPEEFLSAQPQVFSQLKNITKCLYDLSKSEEFGQNWSESALPELIVENFDEEQIWQQLELQNSGVIDNLLTKISHLVTAAEKQPTEKLKVKASKNNSVDKETVNFGEDDEEEEEELVSDDSDRVVFKGNNVLDMDSDDDSEIDFRFPQSNLALMEDGESESDDEDLINKETSKSKGVETKKRQGRSVVDDKFFKLADMESFLEQEDAREERRRRGEESEEDEEDVDMFADIPSDEEEGESGKQMFYDDFFDPPEELEDSGQQKKKSKDSKRPRIDDQEEEGEGEMFEEEEMDEEEDEDNDTDEEDAIEEEEGDVPRQRPRDLLDSDSEGEDPEDVLGRKPQEKSTFEKQQAQLRKKITKMEEASLAEKPWQLAGEIGATDRPENSLLEEHLMYDQTVRLPPVITEETTQSLESIIMQRIKDKAFDDVERKVKPKENPFEYKKRIVLDQEKSKISLGEVYEQEYLKQQKEEGEEKTDPQHEEIKSMMQSLFVKLDALSNFHYTPRAAAPEVKIVTNLPSIMMEEVAPVTQGDGTLLAPEEIKDKKKGELKGKTEETETDKKSQRRNKKTEKRKRQREKKRRQALVEKLNPGLGNKYSKEKAIKELEKSSKSGSGVTMLKEDKTAGKQKLGSSRSFFTQLQEDAQSQIKKRKAGPSSKKTVQKSAKIYKL
ncbi:U3 small nucleolar ribonucleoprotein protein MPP10-like [Saccostrea cucullata]|uniref:U3 small nucleolar ribonucleoprotein protein MPP10-like n=1 Tax=Saccostrea cuccullata TaxID=36930 RepID=UPI002ED667F3